MVFNGQLLRRKCLRGPKTLAHAGGTRRSSRGATEDLRPNLLAGETTSGGHGSTHRNAMDMRVGAYERRFHSLSSIRTLDYSSHVFI